jgi:hypothetical protein
MLVQKLNIYIYIALKKMSWIELLLVKYILKVLVFWGIFSQWIIHIDVAIVDSDYE